MFHKSDRLALFIDGASLYYSSRSLQLDVDFKKLRNEFMCRGKLIRANYYMTLLENSESTRIRSLTDWLCYNGYNVVTKLAKEYVDIEGRKRVKGSMDVELTVGALELASRIDHAIIFSGDDSICSLIRSLQRQAVRVSVASTIRGKGGNCSDELRREADNFIELDELRDLIGRPLQKLENA